MQPSETPPFPRWLLPQNGVPRVPYRTESLYCGWFFPFHPKSLLASLHMSNLGPSPTPLYPLVYPVARHTSVIAIRGIRCEHLPSPGVIPIGMLHFPSWPLLGMAQHTLGQDFPGSGISLLLS